MKALILAIKKLLSVIIAILIPAAPVVPNVTPQPSTQQDNTVIEEKAPETSENVEIVEDEPQVNNEETNNDETNNEAAVPAPQNMDDAIANEPAEEEAAAPAAALETRDEEFTPVQTWDVSATEDDNVTMAFYDTEDTEALLAQLAGKVNALFAPMVAMAAETDNENAEQKNANVEIFYEDGYLDRGNDFGDGNTPRTEPEEYKKGTVVVYGEGAMQDYIYNNFMSVNKYLATTKAEIEAYYTELKGEPVTVYAEYDPTITDVVELDSSIRWFDERTGEEVFITDEIRENLVPAEMLKFSPTTLIIEEGVTNISDCAFAMCGNITEVVIPETVVEIGCDAFGYCKNLTTVILPASLEYINANAFEYCTALTEIVLPENIKFIGAYAFDKLAEGSTIVCPNADIAGMLTDYKYDTTRTTVVIM